MQQVAAQLPWFHSRVLLDKVAGLDESQMRITADHNLLVVRGQRMNCPASEPAKTVTPKPARKISTATARFTSPFFWMLRSIFY